KWHRRIRAFALIAQRAYPILLHLAIAGRLLTAADHPAKKAKGVIRQHYRSKHRLDASANDPAVLGELAHNAPAPVPPTLLPCAKNQYESFFPPRRLRAEVLDHLLGIFCQDQADDVGRDGDPTQKAVDDL